MSWLRYIILPALRHPSIVAAGFREATCGIGVTFDDDPYSDRSVAYDVGRTLRAGVSA